HTATAHSFQTGRDSHMSEETQQRDALEQRLRARYMSAYGQPPAHSAIWERVAMRLDPEDTMQTDETKPAFLELSSDPHVLTPPNAPGVVGNARRVWPLPALPALAAVLVVAVLAGMFLGPLHPRGQNSAGAKATPTRPQPTPTLTTNMHVLTHDEILPGTSIAAVDMLSANDGWAVGHKQVNNLEFDTLILHYNGTHWTEVSPVIQNAGLEAISMASPTEGWAGGANTSGPLGAVLLHYTEGR